MSPPEPFLFAVQVRAAEHDGTVARYGQPGPTTQSERLSREGPSATGHVFESASGGISQAGSQLSMDAPELSSSLSVFQSFSLSDMSCL